MSKQLIVINDLMTPGGGPGNKPGHGPWVPSTNMYDYHLSMHSIRLFVDEDDLTLFKNMISV